MTGKLIKFEKTEKHISVILHCPLDADKHALVDMLDREVTFGLPLDVEVRKEAEELVLMIENIINQRVEARLKGETNATE